MRRRRETVYCIFATAFLAAAALCYAIQFLPNPVSTCVNTWLMVRPAETILRWSPWPPPSWFIFSQQCCLSKSGFICWFTLSGVTLVYWVPGLVSLTLFLRARALRRAGAPLENA